MDLPEDEALRINAGLEFPKSFGIDPATGKEKYVRVRTDVEAWDRSQHLARNGAVDTINPVYATLLQEPVPCVIGHPTSRICFPAEWIDPKFISVSFGDSFPNFFHANDPSMPSGIMGKSYSAAEFAGLIDDGQLPTDWPNPTHSHGHRFYVEARIYTRNLPTFEMASQLVVSQRPTTATPKRTAPKPADDIK